MVPPKRLSIRQPRNPTVSSITSQAVIFEARLIETEPFGQRAHHLMIATAFAGCLDNGFGNAEINVPAAGIHIVMLEEHGRRQDDIGEFRGLCHELFVNDQKQIVAAEALMHLVLVRTDNGRIGVLDQHRLDRRPPFRSSSSPSRIGPRRHMSSSRTDLSRKSRPITKFQFSGYIPALP